jgi:WD40 repeat protein
MKKVTTKLSNVGRFCYTYSKDYQEAFSVTLRTMMIPIVFLISLSGCSPAREYSQPTPGLVSDQSPFHFISTENVEHMSQLKQWKTYDVNTMTWSTDSSKFAIAGKENSADSDFGVYAYDINHPQALWFSKTYVPFSLAYSPDDRLLAVPALGLDLLDANTGESIKKIPYQKGCIGTQAIKYDSAGSRIFTLGTVPEYRTTTVYIWDAVVDDCLGVLPEEQGIAFGFELSRDNRFLVMGLSDVGKELEQQVHVWDIGERKLICSFKGAQPIAFASDGGIIATGNVDKLGDIDLWDAKSCQFLDSLHHEESAGRYSMDFSPDGELLAVGDSNAIQIWDVENKKLLFTSDRLPNYVKILAFSPDGRFLLSETDKTTVEDKAIVTLWGVGK